MALINNTQALKSVRQRNYLARDFDSFRSVLLEYARQYYPDKIKDFSESSVGGLFLDMAAYVGDNLSFYLDHLYGELNFDTVIEAKNIEQIIKNAGLQITGAAPAITQVDFYIEVPVADDGTDAPPPRTDLLATIVANTVLQADNGTRFTLIENVDFWQSNPDTGVIELNPAVDVSIGRRIAGTVATRILKASGLCISGVQTSETFQIGEFQPFKTITLSLPDVSNILSVIDSKGNIYYEVENLTHDVVYKNTLNTSANDSSLVKDSLKVVPAPYRYTKQVSITNKAVTLTFGGGTADSLDDDAIPDPSEFAIPLRYTQTFSRRAVNPQRLLQTSTLGVGPANSSLTVIYRYGGGLLHNVPPGNIKTINFIEIEFPENPPIELQTQVKNGIEVFNPTPATGGEDAPTNDEILALVPALKSAQERIVTKEDLLARVYTMPSNFGRVFRASVSNNPNNPLASRLHVISRTPSGVLIPSPDTLKINLKRYLNSYRMISDAIDILDAEVINLEVFFQVVADPSYNKTILIKTIIESLQSQLNSTNFHINQPIVKSDIISTIYSHQGVIGVESVVIRNLFGIVTNRSYSEIVFDVRSNTKNQIIYPTEGGIFEVRFPDINIIGKAVSNV